MTPVKTIIVDDEHLARSELCSLLQPFDFIEICGQAANATQASRLVREFHPQLLFLDIEMPGRNGFEFLESLPSPRPSVIFTTAFDAFAIRAFAIDALDYLLKPISPRRLEAALDKVRLRVQKEGAAPGAADPASADSEEPLTENDHVFVREGDSCWFVPVNSIFLLEAEGNHTRIHFGKEKPLLYRALVSMESRLPAKLFLRANRSQLVNLTFIESIGQWFSGTLKTILRGGVEVEFSRRQAQIFRDRLSL